MPVYKNASILLKKTNQLTNSLFPDFGPNKSQEISRLIFEIAKRDNIRPQSVISNIPSNNFHRLKDYLIKQRFPYAALNQTNFSAYLSKLKLDPKNKSDTKKQIFYPKKLFIERNIKNSHLARRFIQKFPQAKVCYINSMKAYLRTHKRTKISDYNKRRDAIFITEERFDLFKKCPCTKGAVRCGYHIFNLGFGCTFDCSYCYLQEYSNVPGGIVLPCNLNLFFDNFIKYKQKNMRIGTGEFSDSLMLDDITEYSLGIVNFFKKHEHVSFEFKTKSKNINNLLNLKHSGNIIISWSLNPQDIINENEFFTASLNQRLKAAQKCARAGYKVGFHFDPIFYYKDWHKDYRRLIDKLFLNIRPKDIAWISLGTFRFTTGLKDVIEQRFPQNKILNEELIIGYDRKLRYPHRLRLDIYQTILKMFQKHKKSLPIYLCMEEKSLWKRLGLRFPF